jgi:hypothetical protein
MTRAIATSDKHPDDADVAQPSHPGANPEVESDAHTADEAWDALFKIFSSPSANRYAHLSCRTDGPTEYDLLFDSIFDGPNPKSKYKRWIRRLRRHGLIPS